MPVAFSPPGMSDSEPIVVPSARDVRASLDTGATGDGRPGAHGADGPRADACVVACPPHPQQRGHRGDQRLVAIADRLTDAGVDCLRFDYGDWDEGYGELGDTYAALEWANERYERVGLTGFSFGGCLTLLAAGGTTVGGSAGPTPDLDAAAALAPPSRLNDDLRAVPAMEQIDAPATVVYGERDDVADWEPVIEAAERLGWPTTPLSADHFFVGRTAAVGDAVGEFLLGAL